MTDFNIIASSDKLVKIFLPAISESDFSRAKKMIFGFRRWSDFDDYSGEIEGYHVGLTMAGLDVTLVSFSLAGFMSWAEHAAKKLTLHNLTEFARIVAIGRDNPTVNIGLRPAKDRRKALIHLQAGAEETTLAVSRELFKTWRSASSGMNFTTASCSADAYSRLLLESWFETP